MFPHNNPCLHSCPTRTPSRTTSPLHVEKCASHEKYGKRCFSPKIRHIFPFSSHQSPDAPRSAHNRVLGKKLVFSPKIRQIFPFSRFLAINRRMAPGPPTAHKRVLGKKTRLFAEISPNIRHIVPFSSHQSPDSPRSAHNRALPDKNSFFPPISPKS